SFGVPPLGGPAPKPPEGGTPNPQLGRDADLFRFFPGQHGGAGDAGVVAEPGGDDLDAFQGAGHGVILRGLDDDAHHLVGKRFDDAAAQDDDLRVEHVDQVGGGNADVLGGAFDNAIHEFITTTDGFAQVAAAQVGQVITQHLSQERFLAVFNARLDLLEDGGPAGEGFETSLISAAAFGAADFQDHMANFAGRVPKAAVKFAVYYQSAADARSDENADHAARFGFEFGHINAQGRDVAIVFDKHRHAENLFQLFFER